MIKIILFDCDGLIIRHAKYFSQRLKEQKGIDANAEGEKAFFKNKFLLCETGKADLKQELNKQLPTWGWKGTVEELMDFWFAGEREIDGQMKDYIAVLRKKGIKSFLSTNNEKYRTEYLANEVGLSGFLDGIFSSCYLGYLKPGVEFWGEIYKNLPHIKKHEFLVWDDQQSAIHSAKAFGFNAEFYSGFDEFIKTMIKKYQL